MLFLPLCSKIDAHDPPLSNDARTKAWSFVHYLVVHKPKALVKKKLLPAILQQVAHCLATGSAVFTEVGIIRIILGLFGFIALFLC